MVSKILKILNWTNIFSYSTSLIYRQFKITDDIPAPYARERQVLLGTVLHFSNRKSFDMP